MKEINIKMILTTLLISLLVFFVGNYLVNGYQLNWSLHKDLMEIEGVKEVKIDESKVGHKLYVKLQPVDDLQNVFIQIKDRVNKTLEQENYEIVFNSDSSPVLEQVYDEINLVLYQSLETGEFVKLGVEVKNSKEEYGLTGTEVKVDQDHIYLSLMKDEKVFYKVIKRNETNKLGGEMNG